MKRLFKVLFVLLMVLLTALALAVAAGVWHARSKLPQRSGSLALHGLQAPVQVHWDERGVPHLQAQNEADLYRALGFVHAQDRLFQMEMVRRLARGELAEILGPKLLDTDRLFRTLELRAHAEEDVRRSDRNSPAWQALQAYLDGINAFQDTRPLPIEFQLLGIQPQPYTPVDTLAVAGYLAYSFAAALRTEPALTYVRDQLGPEYLRVFEPDWQPLGVLGPLAQQPRSQRAPRLGLADWQSLARVAEVSQQALELAGVPLFEGSNAWALAGRRTASGKPLLAGDPHIAFSLPAVWYEAHLNAPGFELYGHFQALNPFALLGHNQQFGWSLTMFQNDDMDLVALRANPANPRQVASQGQWVELRTRSELIQVKGAEPVSLTLQRSPHGPVINQAFPDSLGTAPVALWWTFLETENPLLEAFHELNRAATLAQARSAASKIHAPGLNVIWANAAGDIGWWAAAKLVQRPLHVNPAFILDGDSPQADKPGYYRFADNPQEENPARGYIVSANHQPVPRGGVPVPGYYNLPDRARRLDQLLRARSEGWTVEHTQALQLDETTDYGPRVLRPLLPLLRAMTRDDPEQRALVDQLSAWDGRHEPDSIAPTVFNQFLYELARAAMADEMGPQFANLLRTRAIDHALPGLMADPASPWWDQQRTAQVETRNDIVQQAWQATLSHLRALHGASLPAWTWSRNHSVVHAHPLGRIKPLDRLFNVGPLPAPGGRELPNNLAQPLGPAPWSVTYGPSTRRVIDFAAPGQARGINPVGQSGVLFDAHYKDQAQDYLAGRYHPMHLDAATVQRAARSTLQLLPQD